MKLLQRVLIYVGLLSGLILPCAGRARDGWVEISPTLVEKNQPATIALIQGNHSNEHKSYRIAGKWDAKYTTLAVVDPICIPSFQSSLAQRC
jgi:hypothetical protein